MFLINPVWLDVNFSVRYFVNLGKNRASNIFCKGLHIMIGRICFLLGVFGNTLFNGTNLDVKEHLIPLILSNSILQRSRRISLVLFLFSLSNKMSDSPSKVIAL